MPPSQTRKRRMARWALLALSAVASSGWAAKPLLGPAVGSFEGLQAEGAQAYNRKDYLAACEAFFKATRAAPGQVSSYLKLARASAQAKEFMTAAFAYRAYLSGSLAASERAKAEAEAKQVDRKLGTRGRAEWLEKSQRFIEQRARFFNSLQQGKTQEAAQTLLEMIVQDVLALDLEEMAGKVAVAALKDAQAVHEAALTYAPLDRQKVEMAISLFDSVEALGGATPTLPARRAFLSGLLALYQGRLGDAEKDFSQAAAQDPSQAEYAFHQALCLCQQGQCAQAVGVLEQRLPNDPRTLTWKAVLAEQQSPAAGAEAMERLLFGRRWAAGAP